MAIITLPCSPCGRRWRRRASKTPVYRRALAPDEGTRGNAHSLANRRYRAYPVELSCARSKPAPDGATPHPALRATFPRKGGRSERHFLQSFLEFRERIEGDQIRRHVAGLRQR